MTRPTPLARRDWLRLGLTTGAAMAAHLRAIAAHLGGLSRYVEAEATAFRAQAAAREALPPEQIVLGRPARGECAGPRRAGRDLLTA